MRTCIDRFRFDTVRLTAAAGLLASSALIAAYAAETPQSAPVESSGPARAEASHHGTAPSEDTAVRHCVNGVPQADTVACVRNRAITLSELDHEGDHALHEALDQLYRQRMVVLYRLLSNDLLSREANVQHTTVEALLEREVNTRVPAVSDAEAAAFLKERLSAGAAITTADVTADAKTEVDDPQRVRQAASYLTLKRRAERKRAYLEDLFKHYDVKVNLDPPPPAPAEEIRGPMTPAIGPAAAPVTVVVFSDYLCPYCKALSHTLESLVARYPSDVRVVYRQFPIHPHADRLAEAALCAEDQGHFAAYHNLLFDRTSLTDDALAPLATEAGLDRLAFTACLGSERNRTRVQDDLAEGKRLAIQGTPTLFINGVRLEGNQTLENLSARVELLRQPHATLAASRSPAQR